VGTCTPWASRRRLACGCALCRVRSAPCQCPQWQRPWLRVLPAAVASSASSWRAALNATDPIGTPPVIMPCASGPALAVYTFALSGKSARVSALLACHWHFRSWSVLPSRWRRLSSSLRLDCSGGVWRGYSGCIIHDGSHELGPSAPPFSRRASRNQSRWGLNHMQNSAGPSAHPCCVPSTTEAKSANEASVARGGARPQEGADKG
jgi:hypothetical protein